jgi:hypothetical protein
MSTKHSKFADLMKRERHNNTHKSDFDSWLPSKEEAIKKLEYYVDKLRTALEISHYDVAIKHAADIGNIAMKIADMSGGLRKLSFIEKLIPNPGQGEKF